MSKLPSCHGDGDLADSQNNRSSHKQRGRRSETDSTHSKHQTCDSTVENNHHVDGDEPSDSNASEEGALVAHEGQLNRDSKADKIRTMEVCREYMHKRCRRTELQCRYAHPPSHVEVVDGQVTCCYDFSKGRCRRVSPPCRYYHPPSSAVMPMGRGRGQPVSQMNQGSPMTMLHPYIVNAIAAYTASLQQQMLQQQMQLLQQHAAFMPGSAGMPFHHGAVYTGNATSMGPSMPVPPRDTIEVCREFKHSRCQRSECRYAHPPDGMPLDNNNCVKVCVDYVNGKCEREACRYYHPPAHLAQRVLNQLRNNNLRKENSPSHRGQSRASYRVE